MYLLSVLSFYILDCVVSIAVDYIASDPFYTSEKRKGFFCRWTLRRRGEPPINENVAYSVMKKVVKTTSTLSGVEKGSSGGSVPATTSVTSAPGSQPLLPQEPESMRKLRALKEKITSELQQEQRDRQDFDSRDVIVPLSLAADYSSTATKKGGKAVKQQVEKLVALTKEKVGGLKQLDKGLQRDLEVELEKKAVEMTQLKAHNQRLRDIITLRQESNLRREEKFESEVARVKALTDEACMESTSYASTMSHLREMNQQVQDSAIQMKAHIEQQAEAERLALIRTYRVRMREVKQQLKTQEALNLEGASAWIRRYNILDGDRLTAEANLKALKQRIELLTTDNGELRVMRKHQEEQRNALAQKIAVLKRENKRYEDHIAKLEGQLEGGSSPDKSQVSNASGTPVRALLSRGGGGGRSGTARRPSSTATSDAPRGPSANASEQQRTQALDQIRRMLEEMRSSLRKVRSAHIELLQERSELEMFLRQCVEDVRRDIYRYTVISNITRTLNGDKWEEQALLQDYGVKDRKRLLDILSSKLEVLNLLQARMFPGRVPDAKYSLSDYLNAGRSSAASEGNDAGVQPQASQPNSTPAVPVVHEMDELWMRWKEWTRSVTPTAM